MEQAVPNQCTIVTEQQLSTPRSGRPRGRPKKVLAPPTPEPETTQKAPKTPSVPENRKKYCQDCGARIDTGECDCDPNLVIAKEEYQKKLAQKTKRTTPKVERVISGRNYSIYPPTQQEIDEGEQYVYNEPVRQMVFSRFGKLI